MAHQIRQPLSVIEAIAYHLDLSLPEVSEEARANMGKLRQQAHEIDRILCDTIHFFQASPVRMQQVDLSKLISHHVSDWPPPNDLNVELRLSENLPAVRLDFQQVQHLLANLLFLFSKTVTPGQAAVVSTTGSANEVVLAVAAGKSNYRADEVTKIFEPFSAHGGGVDLTMASVRRIADVHAARISVECGEGDTVSISIAFPL